MCSVRNVRKKRPKRQKDKRRRSDKKVKCKAQHKTGIGTRQDKAQDMTDDRAQLKTREGRHKRR